MRRLFSWCIPVVLGVVASTSCGGSPPHAGDTGAGDDQSGLEEPADSGRPRDAGVPRPRPDAGGDTPPQPPGTPPPPSHVAEPEDAGADRDAQSEAPRTDYATLRMEACAMAGGECVGPGACSQTEDALLLGLECSAGLVCCRQQSACADVPPAMCCGMSQSGDVVRARAGCDRGSASCAGYAGRWLTLDGDCDHRAPEPDESEPSRWPGALSVAAANGWACDQAGGTLLDSSATCMGHFAPLRGCCVALADCPPADPTTECCDAGQVVPKLCVGANAVCDPELVMLGMLREMPSGRCER